MQTLIQKIHLDGQSFSCRYYRTPDFETSWHKHMEHELILIVEGSGTLLMGDHVGTYHPGDIYFMPGDLPHWFRKRNTGDIGEVLVLHFHGSMFGDQFLEIGENMAIRKLISARTGMQINRREIGETLQLLQGATGFERLRMLLDILYSIGTDSGNIVLTENYVHSDRNAINASIEKIFEYSFANYLNVVKLEEVAAAAGMSIPTFCRFFKKNVKKTYFDFLQDLRIAHACKLLSTTDKKVSDICFESGFNSWAHFSKQFKIVKRITPLKYRKLFDVDYSPSIQ